MTAPTRIGRTAAVQERTDRENRRLEVVIHSEDERLFVKRTVEDIARARVAVTNDLPLIAEQLLSRLLVIANRRYRQLFGEDADLGKWGLR